MTVCQACGAECAEGSRFCSACGAALRAPLRRSERRIVTAMFCDLVGFTALGERADPEDVDAMLRAFSTLVHEVAESFGGVVEKFIGDAAVAVFGVPAAHEDDPERAVRAGLRLVERMAELPLVAGTEARVRVGINTGRALIHLDVDPRLGQGFMVGDAINTAARLQSVAPPMGVLVGETTHAHTAGLFEYEPVAPVELKGKAAPAQPWLARRPLTRTGVEARPQLAEMVGRDDELAALVGYLDEIAAGSSPRLVLLVGEAGIGKSRLIYEVARHTDTLPELYRWRTGECAPFGQTAPYYGLAQVVRAHAVILESDGVPDVERKLDAMLSEAPDRDWLATRLRPLLGLDAPVASAEENAAAWVRVLQEMAAHGPTVLVFENLHWADDGLLRFLGGLMDELADVPLLILCTTRPELLDRSPGFAEPDDRRSRLVVRSLDRRHLEHLAEVLLERAGLPARLGDEVRRHCGGNPLFIEEYVRFLAESAAAPNDAMSDRTAAVPETLEALIAARLDVLKPDCKAILGDAAVMGLEFWRGALTAMEPSVSAAIDAGLQELLDRELVRSLPVSSVEGDAEFVFHHAMIRNVAYEQLPRATRAAKHADVAAWLEGAAGERVEEIADVLAHHWVTALELSRATHQERLAGEALDPAIRSLVRAGDHALALDVAIAESRYAHAVQLAPADDPERPRLLASWARALLDSGRIRESLDVFAEGIAGLRGEGDAAAAALALGDRATALTLDGDGQLATAALREALALLDASQPSASRVHLLSEWASLCTAMSEHDEASRAAEEALELASGLGLPPPVRALASRAAARCASGDDRGFDDYRSALGEARAQGLGRETGIVYFNCAEDIGNARGPREAMTMRTEGLAFARRRRDKAMAHSLAMGLVWDLWWSGGWMQALREIEQLAPQLEGGGGLAELAYVRAMHAGLLLGQGRVTDAQPFLPLLEEAGHGRGEPELRGECLLAAGGVRLALDERDTARRHLASCAEVHELSCEPNFDWLLPRAVRLAVALGDRVLARCFGTRPRSERPLYRCVGPSLSAALAEMDRDSAAAAADYRVAAERWSELGVPHEAALARLGEGRCLLTLGRTQEAAAPLTEAFGILTELGARPEADATRALLASTGLA